MRLRTFFVVIACGVYRQKEEQEEGVDGVSSEDEREGGGHFQDSSKKNSRGVHTGSPQSLGLNTSARQRRHP